MATEYCDGTNSWPEFLQNDSEELTRAQVEKWCADNGLAVVPLTPTKLRVAAIGMTIQGTMDRMELTYDDISKAVYDVAIEPEFNIAVAKEGE